MEKKSRMFPLNSNSTVATSQNHGTWANLVHNAPTTVKRVYLSYKKTNSKRKPPIFISISSLAALYKPQKSSPLSSQQIKVLKPDKMAIKRFAVLLCAEDSEYVKKMYGGYFKVFTELLREEGETWDVYRVAKGEFPRAEDVQAYDGFVITGSCHDAHGDEDWIHELIDLLESLNSLKKKILGICFGHQILSRVLGGKIGRANKGWDIGVRCIHPVHSNSKLLSYLQLPSHLLVIECHQDEVWELPPQAEVIARSDKTGIEMFGYGQHILGIQGHPEYSKDILLDIIDRLLQREAIQNCHVEAAKKSLDAREPNKAAWMALCRSFLKGSVASP